MTCAAHPKRVLKKPKKYLHLSRYESIAITRHDKIIAILKNGFKLDFDPLIVPYVDLISEVVWTIVKKIEGRN